MKVRSELGSLVGFSDVVGLGGQQVTEHGEGALGVVVGVEVNRSPSTMKVRSELGSLVGFSDCGNKECSSFELQSYLLLRASFCPALLALACSISFV